MSGPDEIWRDVPGFEGAYAVSDQGRVKSLGRHVVCGKGGRGLRRVQERVLRPAPGRTGHLSVVLGKGNTRGVHLIVALAFLGPAPVKCEVRHKDGDPANNALGNLHYGTRSENLIDMFYHGQRAFNREQIEHVRRRQREGFRYGEKTALAKEWGVTLNMLSGVAHGRTYRHVR